MDLLIDIIVVYSCFTLQGFELDDLLKKVKAITSADFEKEVIPFLRGGRVPEFNHVREVTARFLKTIYDKETQAHRKFLNSFRQGQLKQELLKPSIAKKIEHHPSITFWLNARNK